MILENHIIAILYSYEKTYRRPIENLWKACGI